VLSEQQTLIKISLKNQSVGSFFSFLVFFLATGSNYQFFCLLHSVQLGFVSHVA